MFTGIVQFHFLEKYSVLIVMVCSAMLIHNVVVWTQRVQLEKRTLV